MSITEHDIPTRVRPNMTEAAKMIGIHVSTLSRDPRAQAQRAGRREKRFAPLEIIRLAEEHKRRSLNEVAAELIEYAAARDPESVAAVEAQLDAYFALGRAEATSGKDAFFADLQRVLPAQLFEKVKAMYFASEGIEPGDIVSDLTDEEIAAGL